MFVNVRVEDEFYYSNKIRNKNCMNSWLNHKERSNRMMLGLLCWLALRFGRQALQLILYPVVAYFILTAKHSRQASKKYLQKVLLRPITWRDTWKHFYTFAQVSTDRLFFLSDQREQFDIHIQGEAIVKDIIARKRGCILIVSHVGSFDIMRVLAAKEHQIPIRILMNVEHNAKSAALLETLDPALARGIIDPDTPPAELALILDQCIKQGEFIGIMADRIRPGDRTINTRFHGAQAAFPAGPWLLSLILKTPVILCFGLYEGKNRYNVIFESISEHLASPRREREQTIQKLVDRYSFTLERMTKKASFNWFNFYDFWTNDTPSNH